MYTKEYVMQPNNLFNVDPEYFQYIIDNKVKVIDIEKRDPLPTEGYVIVPRMNKWQAFWLYDIKYVDNKLAITGRSKYTNSFFTFEFYSIEMKNTHYAFVLDNESDAQMFQMFLNCVKSNWKNFDFNIFEKAEEINRLKSEIKFLNSISLKKII